MTGQPDASAIGLVGYGFGGRVFHAPLIASAPGCRLAGVVTRSPERRDRVAHDLPGTPTFASLAEMAAAGAQAVAISTPVDTHVPLALEAIGLGLAVVCDKPFARDAEAARQVVERAEQAGVRLSVYQNRRWDSDLLSLREVIAAGSIGRVTRFESRFERFKPQPGPGAAGGGALLDFGSHLVDQALLLFGPVQQVFATMHVRGDLAGRDDDVFLVLGHEGGVQSHLGGSWTQGAPGPRLRVTGTTGSFVVDAPDGQEAALVAGATPATEGERWGTPVEDQRGRIIRGGAAEPAPAARGRWDTYYPTFGAAVRGEGSVPVDPRDAVAALEVLDAARRSAEQQQVVRIPS